MQKSLHLWFLCPQALSILSHLTVISFLSIMVRFLVHLSLHCLPPWFFAHHYSMQSRAQASSIPCSSPTGSKQLYQPKKKREIPQIQVMIFSQGATRIQHPSASITRQDLLPGSQPCCGTAIEDEQGRNREESYCQVPRSPSLI